MLFCIQARFFPDFMNERVPGRFPFCDVTTWQEGVRLSYGVRKKNMII